MLLFEVPALNAYPALAISGLKHPKAGQQQQDGGYCNGLIGQVVRTPGLR